MKYIEDTVHEQYWKYDTNCAQTTHMCLSGIFEVELLVQTMNAAAGMHGAGGFRAQCGLVEGALMFLGVYLSEKGWRNEEIAEKCKDFAGRYTEKFGALTCCELRPGGFNADDEPHMCENLTCRSIEFAAEFIREIV